MKEGDDLTDGHNGVDGDAVVGPQLIQGGAVSSPPLHPVHRDNEGLHVHLGHLFEELNGLPHGGAGGDYVLHDDHMVAVLGFVAHHGAALAVVFGLLAVEAVGEVTPVVAVEGGGGRDGQRDALVGRTKEAGDAVGQILLDAGGVIVPQLGGLSAGLVVAGVDKVGGLPAGLGGKVAEGEHAGAHHKGDEFLLIGHGHVMAPFPMFCAPGGSPGRSGHCILLYTI